MLTNMSIKAKLKKSDEQMNIDKFRVNVHIISFVKIRH